MQIILNNEDQTSKYHLIKQSLNDALSFRINRNLSYSDKKQYHSNRYGNSKKNQEEISEWRTQSQSKINDKKNNSNKFFLPDVNKKSKSHNLQELTRELLKYEQFDIQNMNQNNKFRLTLLRQMTKINFKKQQKKQSVSPKTINLKLKFPDYYQKLRQNKQIPKQNLSSSQHQQSLKNSYQLQISSRGLIPSMKKHVGTSFMKKSIFRNQSQYDPYLPKKLNLIRSELDSSKKHIIDQLKLQIDEPTIQEMNNKVKILKVERKLPVNFLSYSNRKNKSLHKLQQSSSKKKTSAVNNSKYLKSFYPNQQNQKQEYESSRIKRLSECLLLNNKIFPHNIQY